MACKQVLATWKLADAVGDLAQLSVWRGCWLPLQLLTWQGSVCRLRGSWLDPFRRSPERALDRRLLADYEADLELLLNCPDLPERHLLAAWPAAVRGYGPIRGEAAAEAAATREHLRQALQA